MALIKPKKIGKLRHILRKADRTLIEYVKKDGDIRSRSSAEAVDYQAMVAGHLMLQEKADKELSQEDHRYLHEEYRSLEKKYDVLHDNLDKKTRSRLTKLLTKALNIVKEGE